MLTPKQEKKQQLVLTEAHNDFQKGLTAYAFFKVHDRSTSDDLVQETFTKTWSYFVKGGKIELMKAFLYHILNNLIIDEYRKRKSTSLDVLLESGFEPSVDESDKLFNILDGRVAMLLISRLPKKYHRIMRMRYVQDLSLQEMSLITGQSKNTIAVQAHRGLEKLKVLHNRG